MQINLQQAVTSLGTNQQETPNHESAELQTQGSELNKDYWHKSKATKPPDQK
jgi:hypothetical protein